jgi:hypothetical protein
MVFNAESHTSFGVIMLSAVMPPIMFLLQAVDYQTIYGQQVGLGTFNDSKNNNINGITMLSIAAKSKT